MTGGWFRLLHSPFALTLAWTGDIVNESK